MANSEAKYLTKATSRNKIQQAEDDENSTFTSSTTTPLLPTIHIINLDHDTHRWETVSKELTSKSITSETAQIKRFSAIYGKNLSPKELHANATEFATRFVTRGIVGCYLSHRRLWEAVSASDEPYQIIFEDDVTITPDFWEKLHVVLQELEENEETSNNNWDVLMLGAIGCVHPEGRHGLNRVFSVFAGGTRTRRKLTDHIHVPRRPMGTHAYILTKKGAHKLCHEAYYAAGHVDIVAWGIPDLKLYCCHPMLVRRKEDLPSSLAETNGMIPSLISSDVTIDNYTGANLAWALNTPVLRFGDFVMTVGRGSTLCATGIFVGLFLMERAPWILPLHLSFWIFMTLLVKQTTRAVSTKMLHVEM